MWRESAAIAGLKNMARLCGKKTENELNGYRVEYLFSQRHYGFGCWSSDK